MKTINLWESESCAMWQRALDSYDDVIAVQGVAGLSELDGWYRTKLPGILAQRDRAYITLEELGKVARWKMKRGVWRQRNMLLIEGNPAEKVESTSREAFAGAPDPRKPIALLSSLAGVGPATASAVMAAHSPSVYPFFDDLVGVQVPGLGPVAFTASYYARYAERLRERAAQLSEACPEAGWTVQAVSQALWAASGGKVGQDKGLF